MLLPGKIREICLDMPFQLGACLFRRILKKGFPAPLKLRQSLFAPAEKAHLEIRLAGFQIIPGQIAGGGRHQVGVGENLLHTCIKLRLPIRQQPVPFCRQPPIVIPHLLQPFSRQA